MRGHLQRVNSLNKKNQDNSFDRRTPSPILHKRNSPRELSPLYTPSHRDDSFDNDRYQHDRHRRHHSHDEDHRRDLERRHGNRHEREQRPPSRVIDSDESDEYDEKRDSKKVFFLFRNSLLMLKI